MLALQFIRDHPDRVRFAIESKGIDLDLDRLLELDVRRRAMKTEADQLRARRNELSSAIPGLAGEEKQAAIAESREVGGRIKALEGELTEVEAELDQLLLLVPGIPAPEVPVGTSEADNLEVRRWGEPPRSGFEARDHLDLALALGMVDLEGPRTFAGSRSYALMGDGALLEQAVLQYALARLVAAGFTAVSPPVMVREEAMVGTGFFPIGREDTYRLERDDLYLCGTSEVGLVSLHREQILEEERLPVRYAGISLCFRREAGAAGRDTKGFYRVHQFYKVEQVSICVADEAVSEREHQLLLGNSEAIVQGLGLPYRVALACTRELGLGQVRKHELETWMPSRGAYCETHSCSTLHDFQARRSNIRYRTGDGKVRFVHTLNNTAIASPRILIAILENYQQADGSVVVPEVLRPYLGGRERLVPQLPK